MFDDQNANPLVEAIRNHRKLALRVFFIVILVLGAGAWLTKRYTASAVLALNPRATLHSDGQTKSVVEVAWTALTDEQIATIIQQFQLDTGLAQLRAQDQFFTYIRSNISLREIESAGSPFPEIAVSYTGQGQSTVMNVANALAQSLAQAKTVARQPSPTGTAATIAAALAKSRSSLKLLSQTQNTDGLQNDLREHLKTAAELQATRQTSIVKLAALERESEQATLAAAKAHTQTPQIANQNSQKTAPQQPIIALQRQIKDAQARLAGLRQRYTDQYPDVEDARETLANLQAELNRLPVAKPQPSPAKQIAPTLVAPTLDEMRIAREEDEIRTSQRSLDQDILRNQNETEALRTRIAAAKTVAQDYVLELGRYNALLEAQETQDGSQSGASAQLAPLFMVVKSATTASPLGVSVKPLFWLASLLAGLFAAAFAAFVAEQFAAPGDEAPSSRRVRTSWSISTEAVERITAPDVAIPPKSG